MDNVNVPSFSYAAEEIRAHNARVSAARSIMEVTLIQPLFNIFIKEYHMNRLKAARDNEYLKPLRLILDAALVDRMEDKVHQRGVFGAQQWPPVDLANLNTQDQIMGIIRSLTRVGQAETPQYAIRQLFNVIGRVAGVIDLIDQAEGIKRDEPAAELQQATSDGASSSAEMNMARHEAFTTLGRFKELAGVSIARSLVPAFANGFEKVVDMPYEKLKIMVDVLRIVNTVIENTKEGL